MHIMLTVASFIAFLACVWAVTRCWTAADNAEAADRTAHEVIAKLRAERDRVTVLERETDALRRELRKVSGKFYASQREDLTKLDQYRDVRGELGHYGENGCENWAIAKQEGPSSAAAKCECLYCMTQRADRERLRRELVPKGALATAETARLNASKP